jgi:hypothetical protein
MITYYEVPAESVLQTKAFEAGALYWCVDTGKVFLDSETQNARIEMSNNSIFLDTESQRENILAPIPNKFYFIKENSKLYVYNEKGWNCVSPEITWDIIKNNPIPNPTTDDNDKFLRIVDGKYTLVTIPNAEEIDFT